MSAVDMANPIAGPAAPLAQARPEAFLLTILVPMYNEEAAADPFFDALLPVLDACGGAAEVLFIDDGSADATVERVLARQATDPRSKLISFTRNFGKEVARLVNPLHTIGGGGTMAPLAERSKGRFIRK